MPAKNSTWIAGAAAGAVVLVAGTWFLGVSPILDETAAVHERREAAVTENVSLETRLTELSATSAKLPELKQELADLQVGIPSTELVDDFLRRLDELQATHQIAAVSIAVNDPVAVVDNQGVTSLGEVQADAASASAEPTEGATASTEPTDGANSTASTDATTDDAAVAAPTTAGPDGFIAVPVTITLLGGFPNSLLFLSDLQSADQRLFLVTGVHGDGQGEAEAADGRPATSVGDVELEITGNLYVLQDLAAGTDSTADGATDGTLPTFGGQAALGSAG